MGIRHSDRAAGNKGLSAGPDHAGLGITTPVRPAYSHTSLMWAAVR